MYDFGEHEDAAYGAPYGIALGDAWGDDDYGDDYGFVITLPLLAIAGLTGAGAVALSGAALGRIIRHGGPKHLQALATRRRKLKAKLKTRKGRTFWKTGPWSRKSLKKRIRKINIAYKKLKARLKRNIAKREGKGKKLTKRQQRSLAIVQRERRRRQRAKARKVAAAGTLLTPSLRHPGRRRVATAKKMRAYDQRAFATYASARKQYAPKGQLIAHKIAFSKAIQVFPSYYKARGTAKLAARIRASGPHTFRPVVQMGPSPYAPSPYTPAYPRDTPASWGAGPRARPLDITSGSFQFPPQSVSAQEYGPGEGQYEEEEGISEEAEVGPEDAYSDEGDDYGEEAPFWKNPLVLGGAAVVGFLAYQQTQKGKKSPKNGKKKAS